MERIVVNVILTVGAVLLMAMGLGLVVSGEAARVLGGVLFLLMGLSGSSMVVANQRLRRRPPQVRLGTAPSGAAALELPYSRFSVLVTGASGCVLVVWCTAATIVAVDQGHPVAAWVLGLLGLAWVVPTLLFLRGRIVAGGLYVTSFGLEHRHEGAGWSVPWEGIEHVIAADCSVTLVLNRHAERHDTTRVVWRREPRCGKECVVVPTQYIAGGPATIGAILDRALDDPEKRSTLAQPHVVDEVDLMARSAAATARPTLPFI